MGYPKRAIKWTIGGEEVAPGTAHAMENVIPIRDQPGVDRKPERLADPAIIGSAMDVGDYLAADDVSGPIPISPRACPGFGKLLVSLLHTESAPVEIGGCMRVRYTGANASCKIMAVNGDNDIHAKTGAVGAEVDDAVWGGGAAISLAAAGTDTLGELVAVIEAYAGFECDKVFGDDALSVNTFVITRTTQAKSKDAFIFFTHAASTGYARNFTPDLTTAERPTYSIQGDGYPDNKLYTGCVIDTLSLKATLKAIVEGDVETLDFVETGGQVASVLTLEDRAPLFFWNGIFTLAGVDFPYIKNFSMKIDNGHNKEGYGQGSAGRQYHEKGLFAITGDMELKLDADSYAHRSDIFGAAGAYSSMSLYFKGAVIGTHSLNEMLLIELPFVQITSFSFGEENNLFTAKMNWKAIYPKGTVYDVPLTMTMISQDAGAF
jgi:hypothetical protein